MKKKWATLTVSAALFLSIFTGVSAPAAHAAAPQTLSYGETGHDVPDLQYRLKTLGYFETDITDYFGPATRFALAKFQRDYGLVVDGIAGANTWAMLKKVSVNRTELDLMARIIYGEARGESYEGQVAVGAVVMNRLASSKFPNTVRGVIEQPGAFTAVSDGQYYMTPDKEAYMAALDAVRGYDPTGGALYYFNPNTATSSWIWSRQQTAKIGRHIFAV
ncbi:spore cortex-lytic enzyme [Paenibacillus nanensis]|uniref:Spore cortex-lytic enzyme n=1 Tax=Paenibacillus nanensis TaxID=393251 RepID=A0A3A1UZQ6_9BACL|nr:spore cortex-lytic enzyme [Paenibacillus nanensis]RIX53745.1 spore cortex-lytic enzyme [Paenibacillus nanensis]